MIGLYKTYSMVDVYSIKEIFKYKRIEIEACERRFNLHTMWARFGEQTVPDLFNRDFHLLTTLQKQFDYFEILEKAPKDHYSTNEVRVASLVTQLTHVAESKDNETAKLSSFFRDNLDSTSLRDVLTKFGWQSRKFSICNVLTDQLDSQKMLKASTASSTEEMSKCYVETHWTKPITTFRLPKDFSTIIIQSKDITLTHEDIKK